MPEILRKLSYKIFSDRSPVSAADIKQYNELHRCWYNIWSSTFLELEGKAKFYSDDFDRLDEVTGIFYGDEAIGVFCFNWFDLAIDSHVNHSYFKAYPEIAMEQIRNTGAGKLMTMGNLGVHPAWRKRENGLISEALLGLGCKRFLNSDADLLIAYTRNERKVNGLCYRHGAKCLVANHTEHNVRVDIISITHQDAIVSHDKKTANIIEDLWRRREVIGPSLHQPAEMWKAA